MMFPKTSGQMTIEFVVAFPAMIAVAFVAINAVLFFSDCASFDRVFRNAVCTYAQMYFEPTLFGKGRLSGVFGFSFPPLSHGEQISVSAYKPGLVF